MQLNPQSKNDTDAILVMTNVPHQACAETIAQYLISQQLAACVNIHAPCQSVYHWQGQIEHATEIPLYIKTIVSRYFEVETAIKQLHPYELPEIVYVHIDGGNPGYIQWLQQSILAPDHLRQTSCQVT